MKEVAIEEKTKDEVMNIVFDTLDKQKQALVFVNTKRSAEKQAEEISKKIKKESEELNALSEQILKALARPTKQCERLARCVKKGIAFHHAGLTHVQKEIIEDSFRNGLIKIICCTPTLCISRDTKIWHETSETGISKFRNSNPLFALSQNKLICMKSQKVQRIKNSSKLIQITSVSGYSIKVTPNHKLLVKRRNQKRPLQAQKIEKSDKIATIGKLNIKNIHAPFIKEFIRDNKIDVPNHKFGPQLSYFIGIMLGDGYSGAETDNARIKYKGSPSIVGIDEEIFSHASEVCSQLKLNCRKTTTFHGTPQLVLGKNKWFREFLVRCGVEKRDKKHISKKLMKMDLENTASLLRGLFDTDGHLDKRCGPGFSNISEKLILQIQKMLLRFGIISTIRKKEKGSMKIYGKEYKTVPCFELDIHQKKSIMDFYRFIGFNIKRKHDDLITLIAQICSNLNYVSCNNCGYKIYKDIFSGRTEAQKEWGQIKLRVIKLLGKKGELGSRELKASLKDKPKRGESRLNHHYELIKKRRIGNRSNTEWIWSLNPIGKWIFDNIINKNKRIEEFFRLRKCPLCKNEVEWVIKRGWRDSDFEGDIFWDKIREIKEVECEDDVYDLILPNKPKNEHMFVANGFIVHNSYGLDLPAFRSIIRDLKRYGGRFGMNYIHTLEYLQMAGRAGRPKFDKWGEAICIASTKPIKREIEKRFINGEAEDIFSKLAVEPVLRTYLLSLISANFIRKKSEIMDFFSKTFWAYQFKDMHELENKIEKMLKLLVDWGFIKGNSGEDEFVSADEIMEEGVEYRATSVGKRVAELYIDPLTAHNIINALKKGEKKKVLKPFSFLQVISHTLEIRPRLRTRVKEWDDIQEKIVEVTPYLLENEPSMYEPEHEEFIDSIKTAMMFQEWIDEKDEEYLMEKYNIRPGEVRVKLNIADWLLYATGELCRMIQTKGLLKEINRVRFRVKYGVKEELLTLLKLEGIGRVRARKLFRNKIKDLADVKRADVSTLSQILGKKTAESVKKQVGEEIKQEVSHRKRKGQLSIKKF